MDNSKIYAILGLGGSFYLWIILFFIGVLAFYGHWIVFAVSLLIYVCLLYYYLKSRKARAREMTKYIENLTFHLDSATKA
ncbi:MAG: hypothetical protein GX066_01540 [Clostridiaceae bacterium]|nr:hypothetical protein [Clostridiaceae bacterium]